MRLKAFFINVIRGKNARLMTGKELQKRIDALHFAHDKLVIELRDPGAVNPECCRRETKQAIEITD